MKGVLAALLAWGSAGTLSPLNSAPTGAPTAPPSAQPFWPSVWEAVEWSGGAWDRRPDPKGAEKYVMVREEYIDFRPRDFIRPYPADEAYADNTTLCPGTNKTPEICGNGGGGPFVRWRATLPFSVGNGSASISFEEDGEGRMRVSFGYSPPGAIVYKRIAYVEPRVDLPPEKDYWDEGVVIPMFIILSIIVVLAVILYYYTMWRARRMEAAYLQEAGLSEDGTTNVLRETAPPYDSAALPPVSASAPPVLPSLPTPLKPTAADAGTDQDMLHQEMHGRRTPPTLLPPKRRSPKVNPYSAEDRATVERRDMGGAVPPAQYCCPITMQLMCYPVMTKDGHNYEYDAIAKWVREKGVCPQTREPLKLEELAPNRFMKELIDEWVEMNCPLKPAEATLGNLRPIEPSAI